MPLELDAIDESVIEVQQLRCAFFNNLIGHGTASVMAFTSALRCVSPSMRVATATVQKRRFHPLFGQSIQEIQAKWSVPPSANLVPIVIEQTVKFYFIYFYLL